MIADSEIRSADPAAVIEQYKRLVFKLAQRYKTILDRSGAVGLEDLHQAGFLAIMDAQRKYDPEKCSFSTMLFNYIRSYMRAAVGINPNTGAAPEQLVYLDSPLSEEGFTLCDTLPDPDVLPMDETIIEDETQRETAEQVRAAVDRIKSDKQRAAISLVWLEGKSRQAAAEEMNMQEKSFCALEKYARSTLNRDFCLRQYATSIFYHHVGLARFNTTWTSTTEYAALWRLEHLPEYMRKKDDYIEPCREWTDAQCIQSIHQLTESVEPKQSEQAGTGADSVAL